MVVRSNWRAEELRQRSVKRGWISGECKCLIVWIDSRDRDGWISNSPGVVLDISLRCSCGSNSVSVGRRGEVDRESVRRRSPALLNLQPFFMQALQPQFLPTYFTRTRISFVSAGILLITNPFSPSRAHFSHLQNSDEAANILDSGYVTARLLSTPARRKGRKIAVCNPAQSPEKLNSGYLWRSKSLAFMACEVS